MKPCLVIERGESRGAVRRLDRRSTVAGRDLSCGLWLPDASLRPRHAEFTLREGRWFVRALEEHAPLRINGLAAREAALSPGDQVDLGDEVSLRFELRASSRRMLGWSLGIAGAACLAVFLLWHRGGSPAGRPPAAPAPITPTDAASRSPEPMAPGISEMEALSRKLEQSVPETPGVVIAEDEPSTAPSGGGIPESTGISLVHDGLTSALASVHSLISEGKKELAVTRAHALLQANPDALPAWAALAEAQEAAANVAGAEEAWRQILLRSDNGFWYDRAAREVSRLTDMQMGSAPPEIPTPVTDFPEEPAIPPEVLQAPLVTRSQLESMPAPQPAEQAASPVSSKVNAPPAAQVPPAAPAPQPATATPPKAQPHQRIFKPVVRIANVQMRRFPPGDHAGEQRILEVKLERASDAKWIRPDHVRVAVEFFDQTPGGAPAATRAKTSPSPVNLSADAWANGSASVNFSYQSDAASSGAPYYGYRVQVFYGNMLQDSDSKPDTLNPP